MLKSERVVPEEQVVKEDCPKTVVAEVIVEVAVLLFSILFFILFVCCFEEMRKGECLLFQ